MRVATGQGAPSCESYATNPLIADEFTGIVTLDAGQRGSGNAARPLSSRASAASRGICTLRQGFHTEHTEEPRDTENGSPGRVPCTGAPLLSIHAPKSLWVRGEISPPTWSRS